MKSALLAPALVFVLQGLFVAAVPIVREVPSHIAVHSVHSSAGIPCPRASTPDASVQHAQTPQAALYQNHFPVSPNIQTFTSSVSHLVFTSGVPSPSNYSLTQTSPTLDLMIHQAPQRSRWVATTTSTEATFRVDCDCIGSSTISVTANLSNYNVGAMWQVSSSIFVSIITLSDAAISNALQSGAVNVFINLIPDQQIDILWNSGTQVLVNDLPTFNSSNLATVQVRNIQSNLQGTFTVRASTGTGNVLATNTHNLLMGQIHYWFVYGQPGDDTNYPYELQGVRVGTATTDDNSSDDDLARTLYPFAGLLLTVIVMSIVVYYMHRNRKRRRLAKEQAQSSMQLYEAGARPEGYNDEDVDEEAGAAIGETNHTGHVVQMPGRSVPHPHERQTHKRIGSGYGGPLMTQSKPSETERAGTKAATNILAAQKAKRDKDLLRSNNSSNARRPKFGFADSASDSDNDAPVSAQDVRVAQGQQKRRGHQRKSSKGKWLNKRNG